MTPRPQMMATNHAPKYTSPQRKPTSPRNTVLVFVFGHFLGVHLVSSIQILSRT
jgi:hypothetical protein